MFLGVEVEGSDGEELDFFDEDCGEEDEAVLCEMG